MTKKNSFALPLFLSAIAYVGLVTQVFASDASDPRVAAAKKEGSLSWIDAIVVPGSAKKIGNAFKKHYDLTNFTVKFRRLNTGKIGALVTEEVKANKVTVDVFAAATPRLFYGLKDAGELMKYKSPQYKFYIANDKKAGLTNEPGYWVSPVAYVMAPITNPKFYKKRIGSWYDFLDPQLKGNQIDWPSVPTSESSLYHYYGLRQVLPREFFEKLAKQQVTTGISSVQKVQKLTTGAGRVTVTTASRMYQNWKRTGVELRANFPKEGIPLFGHPYGILAKAPHPNAAQLFIDFLLSEEGQKLYMGLEGIISARKGIKVPDDVKEYSPQLSDITPIRLDWKNISDSKLKAARQEFIEIFKSK